MPAAVSFVWEPDPMIMAGRFSRVAAALENRAVPLAEAGTAMRADILERFETETDPQGNRWEEWADSYWPVADAYPNEAILTQSGDLREAAISSEAIEQSHDTVYYRTGHLPHFGLAHDAGLPTRKNPLPQREFLGMSDEARVVILGSFYEWFDGSLDLYVTARGNIGRRWARRGTWPTGMRPFIPRS